MSAAIARAAAAAGLAYPVRIGDVRLSIADDQPTYWARVAAGRWEPGTLAILDRMVGPRTTFLDLGAWVGALSLYAAARGAQAVAVEADPAALDQLGRNLAANAVLARRVTVVPGAVAPEPGPVRLGARRKPGDSMSSTLLAGTSRSWTAEGVTPVDLLTRTEPGRELFVKLDVEGGEYALLPRLAPLVRQHPGNMLVAFHPEMLGEAGVANPEAVASAALASLAGFMARPVGPAGCGPPLERPILPPDVEQHDLWLFEPA